MKNNILDYFAKIKSENIHSRGEMASNILLHILKCEPNENVLEIGCGTAATLVNFSSYYKNSSFISVEASPEMYKTAQKRINFCFQKRITLIFNNNTQKLPFSDVFFDKIYAESVIAIQEGEDIAKMFSEIRRVLKPNGILIMNEGIWINSTTRERINEINNFCKSNFGIIQSNSNYPYASDWEKLLINQGFEVEFIKKIDDFEIDYKNKPKYRNRLSKLFSYYGKIQSKFNPELILNYSKFKKKMKVLSDGEKYMSGFIIKCKAK